MADRNREPGRLAFGERSEHRHAAPSQPDRAAADLSALNQPALNRPDRAADLFAPSHPTPGDPDRADD